VSSNSPPSLQSRLKPRVSSFNESPRDRGNEHDDQQPLDSKGYRHNTPGREELSSNANPCF